MVRLNGSPFTIIGVGPRQFTGEVVGSAADVWIPLSMQAQVNPGQARLDRRDSNWLLRPGPAEAGRVRRHGPRGADAPGARGAHRLPGRRPAARKAREIRSRKLDVQPGARGFSWIRKNSSPLLFTLMGIVGLVLVIACANVANLLLARATIRQKEISVRLALGASRGRLIRQLLTEGALLAALGGTAGLLLAGWGSRLLSQLAMRGGPNPIPFDVDVRPNVAVLAFTAAVSLLTAILFGLVPAVRSTRIELLARAERDDAGSGSWTMAAGQAAGDRPARAVGAAADWRGPVRAQPCEPRIARRRLFRDHLLLLKADLIGSGYETATQQLSLTRALIERLRAVPGVAGVTASENGLFSGTDSGTNSLQVDGFQPARADDASSRFDRVGPQCFQVIGVPLLIGRDFDERDSARRASHGDHQRHDGAVLFRHARSDRQDHPERQRPLHHRRYRERQQATRPERSARAALLPAAAAERRSARGCHVRDQDAR